VKRWFILAPAAFLAILAAPALASTSGSSVVPPVQARAYYLAGDDGAVLAARNARQKRAIASITKLMTVVVALERTALADVVRVPPGASRVGESTVYLLPGERMTVADLARAALVPSANDAATALAIHAGGGSLAHFVALMNEKAAALGLSDTHFVNPHGLDAPGHVSSARDATLLVRYALGVPFIRASLERTSLTLPGRGTFRTTDDLLRNWAPLVGGKTGHTVEAGWSQAAGASLEGATVYGAVLGSDTRAQRNRGLESLLRYGLGLYEPVRTLERGKPYAEAETDGGPAVALVAPRGAVAHLRRGTKLVERISIPAIVALPVRQGARIGRIEVWAGGRQLASSPLVAASAVTEPGALGKAWWYTRATARNLWGLIT
jgi:D-alanyl-D-alanine carboxypeptidase (penicillin-binding protein 5/6)